MSTPQQELRSPIAASPPLVWVRQGKIQHAAYLLDENGLVRWASTLTQDRVAVETIDYQLSPRRSPQMSTSSSPQTSTFSSTSPKITKDEKKRKSPQSSAGVPQEKNESSSESSSDDEVEILLTIQPPTPKRPRPQSSTSAILAPNTTREVNNEPENSIHPVATRSVSESQEASSTETESSSSSTTEDPHRNAMEYRAKLREMARSKDDMGPAKVHSTVTHRKAVVTSAATLPPPKHPYRSSAYVQNLAEICYTILHDRRWRVGGTAQRRLFDWTRGDDLGAVQLLSRLYQPPTTPEKLPCKCLLCRDKKPNDAAREENSKPTTPELTGDDDGDVDKKEEEECRAVHLWCRLYYRKGPWFRLDDIYKRYYAPHTSSDAQEEDSEEETTPKDDKGETKNASEIDTDIQRSIFFQPAKPANIQPGPAKDTNFVDMQLIEVHLTALSCMLNDLVRLQTMGLIRSFNGEEECGRTVGSVTLEGSGVLLTAEERRLILSKLGGDKKKDRKRQSQTSTGEKGRTRQQSLSPVDNAIWNQMCKQKSIAHGLSTLGGVTKGNVLLPVRRHVDSELLHKLCTVIILKCRRVEYIPAAALRSHVSNLKKRVCSLFTATSTDAKHSSLSKKEMCVRLREAPLHTLRRCARLFVCANSGPGNMRNDGTNAWRSVKEFDALQQHIPLRNVVRPPGVQSFHNIAYPGMSHRFGLSTYAFREAHNFLPVQVEERCSNAIISNSSTLNRTSAQVFESTANFRVWEASVEVRVQVDYLTELNDMIHYQERRRLREAAQTENRTETERSASGEEGSSDPEDSDLELTVSSRIAIDFLELLTVSGRKALIYELHAFTEDERGLASTARIAAHVEPVCRDIENDISKLERRPKHISTRSTEFQSNCEKVLCVISIIIIHTLILRNKSISKEEVKLKTSRPWLRHLWWEGVLAYALWDCIPILERRGFYNLASKAIEVILFGAEQRQDWKSQGLIPTESFKTDELSSMWVSRRTRGKLHERLMIDYIHLIRQHKKEKIQAAAAEIQSKSTVSMKRKAKKKSATKQEDELSPQDHVGRLCKKLLDFMASNSIVPFSVIRSLARRTKQPLFSVLADTECPEATILGLRLGNGTISTESVAEKGYIDWSPPTDTAVANSLVGGQDSLIGRRCSFVGFEDGENERVYPSSLNVEQLAMEFYATGRLPCVDTTPQRLSSGGWVGWHDEGGYVRTLFRLLCSSAILGMNSGCGSYAMSELEEMEHQTIHLTPYQGSSFDLHVAFWTDPYTRSAARGFFERRRSHIDEYFRQLELLDGQALSDLVHDAIIGRLELTNTQRIQDVVLAKDVQQIRTLSMLAAGFGGVQLAAMFRCLCFDYRHYSGGLPDLLLTRAYYEEERGDDAKEFQFVDLGQWVGESFSEEFKQQREETIGENIVGDDEFLGCSKVGDSGGQSSSRWRKGGRKTTSRSDSMGHEITRKDLPSRLSLVHDSRKVHVQCMLVEVKSQNDRLDGRQEDWLNVLDRVGHARVCKFDSGKKPVKNAKAKKTKSGQL